MNSDTIALRRLLYDCLETRNAYALIDLASRPDYPQYHEAKRNCRHRVRRLIKEIRRYAKMSD